MRCVPSLLVAALLLCGCQARELSDGTPFDDLLRFVPESSESLLCIDFAHPGTPHELVEAWEQPAAPTGEAEPRLRRLVIARQRFSFGDFEGVILQEYECEPEARRRRLLYDTEFRRESISGVEVFFPNDPSPRINAHAYLGRIELTATRNGLIERAVLGHEPGGIVRAEHLGLAGRVDWRQALVLLRRINAANADDPINLRGHALNDARLTWYCLQVPAREPLTWQGTAHGERTDAAADGFEMLLGEGPGSIVVTRPGPKTIDFTVRPASSESISVFSIFSLFGAIPFI